MPSSSDSHQRQISPGRRKSDDPNNQRNTCLYIGNIDKRVDDEKLKDIFRKYGELEYCFLIYEPSTNDRSSKEIRVSRGYGFAKFVKNDDLLRAKQELDGYEINGRKIKVQISKRNKPREQTPGRYLGKKRPSPQRYRHRGHSRSRSQSDSYSRRRHHEKKQKHRRRRQRQRSRQSRERSRQRARNNEYRHRKRSYSNQHQRRREKE